MAKPGQTCKTNAEGGSIAPDCVEATKSTIMCNCLGTLAYPNQKCTLGVISSANCTEGPDQQANFCKCVNANDEVAPGEICNGITVTGTVATACSNGVVGSTACNCGGNLALDG